MPPTLRNRHRAGNTTTTTRAPARTSATQRQSKAKHPPTPQPSSELSSTVPPIDRVPNEVLQQILDYVFPDSLGHKWVPDILSLRATCRRFRAIISHLNLWKSYYFDLDRLLINDNISSSDLRVYNNRGFKLLRWLKEDPVLFETLGRKEEWSFRTVDLILHLFVAIPIVKDNLKRFSIEVFESTYMPSPKGYRPKTITDGIKQLGHCPNLSSIDIGMAQDVPLDLISHYCPFLTKLALFDCQSYTGSLCASNLEHLTIYEYSLAAGVIRDFLFPVDSSHTLKSLEITYNCGPRVNPYFTGSICAFPNLTWLTLAPFTNSVYNMLQLSHLPNLRAFVTVLKHDSDISLRETSGIFSFASCNRLHILGFLVEPSVTIPGPSDFNEAYYELVKAVVSNLSSTLEYLHLSLGLNTAWFRDVKELSQLKALYWKVVDRECLVSDNPASIPGYDGPRMRGFKRIPAGMIAERLTRAADKQFMSGNKPMVKISVLKRCDYDGWDPAIFGPEESGFQGNSFDASKVLKIYWGSI